MDLKDQEEQRQFKQELERLQQQLRDAQEELLHERRNRIQEKQRELDERLARSMANASSVVSESSLRVKEQKGGTSMPTVPPLDMSSFLNTSIELPEKIKEIMDEWKQRMENAIAGTVRSISDQSRRADDLDGAGAADQRAEDSHEDCKQEDGEEDVDVCSEANEDEVHDDAPSYQHEQNSRSHCSQQRSAYFIRRKKLHLGSVPKVNRMPFDKYLSIESIAGSEAENGRDEGADSRQDESYSEGDNEEQMQADRRRNDERQNGRDRAPGKQSYHNHARTVKESFSRESNRLQRRHHRRKRHDSVLYEEDNTRRVPETGCRTGDEDGVDDGCDGEGRRCRENEICDRHSGDFKIAVMDSINNQSFTLVNSFAESDHRAGMNTSFSSLYETSLFDVVDAMEGVAASRLESSQTPSSSSHRYDISCQSSRTNQFSTMEHSDDAALDGNGVATDTSPSTRLQRLMQGMEARERKLARLGGHNCQQKHTTDAQQHDAHMSSANGFRDARDDDFDIFNDVKDIYEKELFESRQQRGSGAAAWTSNGGAASANLHQWIAESGDDETLGPPLSPQDLSVREAIEKEMAELLQEETFQQLLQ